MKLFLILLLLISLSSCQFFETEKITSDTFYKEELRVIDWKEVDIYPEFSQCEATIGKAAKKSCFEDELSKHLLNSVYSHNLKATNTIHDTLQVAFRVEKDATLMVETITMDSLVLKEFPLLKSWITQGIDSLNLVAPAYKRGIPVTTTFRLPVVLQTEEL